MRLLVYLSLIIATNLVNAKEAFLRFSYWAEASAPFVILDDPEKPGDMRGILKDLADALALGLQRKATFVNLPVQRIERQLNSGEIDIDCITQPGWKENPEALHWSPVIFKGADRFLVKSENQHSLITFDDLRGRVLGIYHGYLYHPQIMQLIENGDIQTIKVSGIDHGVQLLLLDRIDALIDFDILLNYKISSGYQDQLVLADLIAEQYDLYCAYSKKMNLEASLVDSVIKDLTASGKIDEIINRYSAKVFLVSADESSE